MKKFMYAWLVFLLTLIVAPSLHGYAAASLKVDVKTSFDNRAKEGELTPVFVTVTNNGEYFEGIFSYDSVESYNTGTAYTQQIRIEKGETQSFSFLIIPSYEGSVFTTSVFKSHIHFFEGDEVGKNEVKVDLKSVKAPSVIASETSKLLVISTKKDAAKQLVSPQAITLQPWQASTNNSERLSNNYLMYDMYDIIFVDETGIELLTAEQIAAIEKWQLFGGVLWTIGQFKTDWPSLIEADGTVAEHAVSLLANKEQDKQIVAQKHGEGYYVQSTFDVQDDSLLSQASRTTAIRSALRLLNENTFNTDGLETLGSMNVYQNEMFDTFFYKTWIIYLFLIIYIAVVGPLLYFLLKRKDKREKMWIFVPIVAIIGSLLMFVIGAKDRITKPHTQTTETVIINEDGSAISFGAFSLLANKKDDYAVQISKDAHLLGVKDDIGQGQKKDLQLYNNFYTTFDEVQTLHIKDVPYWNTSSAVFKETIDEIGQFEQSLQLKNGKLVGEIKNTLPYDVEDVQLLTGTRTVELGAIKSGETIQVDEDVKFTLLTGPSMLTSYTNDNYENSKEYNEFEQKNQLKQQLTGGNLSRKAVLIGYANERVSSIQLTKNNKEKALTMFAQSANIDVQLSGDVKISSNEFTPTLTPMTTEGYGDLYVDTKVQATIVNGEYELTFERPSALDFSEIEWSLLQVKNSDATLKVELYNVKKKKYEPIIERQVTKQVVENYFDENGALIFKISTTEGYYGSMFDMPTFTLEGVAK